MYHYFFIHSSVDWHLDCFYVLVIVNCAAMNNGIHVSLSVMVSSGYMHRSGIVGSYGGFIPSVLRNLHTIFHSGCIILHSPTVQECSLFSTPSPAFIVCRCFDEAILTDVRWYLIVVLICISLIMSNVEHLFKSLLVICMSSLEKCLFRSFSHFSLGCFPGIELYD